VSESRQELIDGAIDAEEQVAYALLALAESDWLALDLTLTQLKALMVLVAVGTLPIHQLADTLHLGRPATSTLIDQLVRLDLVTRMEDPTDRRRTLVTLTPQGKSFVTRLRQGGLDKMQAALGRLADDDLIAFTRILHALAQGLGELRQG
jgi:DNA-binding MarR family transcriptional regulator